MTPEQIEATRPAFKSWSGSDPVEITPFKARTHDENLTAWCWAAWQAAKADTLAQADHPEAVLDMVQPDHVEHDLTMSEPVRLTDAEVDSILEKPMPDGVHDHKTESYAFARDIADAIHAKGLAPAPLTT